MRYLLCRTSQPTRPTNEEGPRRHHYKGRGATALFAAFDVVESKVIGRYMHRPRHQEFIRFLKAVERELPPGNTIYQKAVAEGDTRDRLSMSHQPRPIGET